VISACCMPPSIQLKVKLNSSAQTPSVGGETYVHVGSPRSAQVATYVDRQKTVQSWLLAEAEQTATGSHSSVPRFASEDG